MKTKTKDKIDAKTDYYATLLQVVYIVIFFIFLLNVFAVDILFAPPHLALLRVPSNIRAIGFFLNAPWTQSLRIYHIFLLVITVLGSLNLIALSSLENSLWRIVCKISSFFGLLILWSIFMFFALPFILNGISFDYIYLRISFIYAAVTFILLILDVATFLVVDRLD